MLRRPDNRVLEIAGSCLPMACELRIVIKGAKRCLSMWLVEHLVVWKEDRIVEPEITLQLHGVDHLLHVEMDVRSNSPDADGSTGRAQSQVPAVMRELHLGDLEHRVDFSSGQASSNLVHQHRVPGEVSFVCSKMRGQVLLLVVNQVGSILVGEGWHHHKHIQPRRIDLAAACVEWHLDGPSQLSSVNPEHVDPAFA